MGGWAGKQSHVGGWVRAGPHGRMGEEQGHVGGWVRSRATWEDG